MNIDRTAQRRRFATEQAAEWLFALRAGTLSAQERNEFLDWLRESPLHVAEMLRMGQLDQALDTCTRWGDAATEEQGRGENVIEFGDRTRAEPRRSFRAGWAIPWVAAAGLAALTVLAVGFFVGRDQLTIRTQIAERRELTLTDGSTVEVAPATELSVRMEAKQRLIKLARGQAYFHVAKNPRRPFIVDAGSTIVTAVGTAFDVARSGEGVTVTVVEGKVAITREDSRAQRPAAKPAQPENFLLRADEQAVLTPSTAEAPVRSVNGAAEVAWTGGNLVFTDETLAEVVRRFNLYNQKQIRILDQQLASRRVSGIFKASDPESLIEFVRAGNPGPESAELIRLDEPAN
jgi:transmembrane sensor